MPPIRHLPALLLLAIVTACSGQPGQVPPAPASAAGTPASQVDWQAMAAFWERASALRGSTPALRMHTSMVVYFDPHCPVCAQQWAVLRPYMDEVRIHWVPVAYIDATSARVAAAMRPRRTRSPRWPPMSRASTSPPARRLSARPGAARVRHRAGEEDHAQRDGGRRSGRHPDPGFELIQGKRHYKMAGLLDAEAARVAVGDLGNTWDPWAKRGGGQRQ